jgi:hypothetical protein
VVLNIMSPSSLQGGLTHSNNGAVAGWGLADLLDPADAVLDTVVVMDDSTAGINTLVGTDPNTGNAYPGIPLKYEGCNLDTNSAWQTSRLNGKIVLIARGTCEFGLKVYLARSSLSAKRNKLRRAPSAKRNKLRRGPSAKRNNLTS